MKKDLISMLEAFRMGHEARAGRLFKAYAEKKVYAILHEDHQRYMTSEQMEAHINMLHGKADDKDAFLKKLASFSTLDRASEKDFRKCAEDIQGKGKIYMDKAIHALEKMVGYKFDPKNVEENFGNVITRPVDSVVVGLPKIPNTYTTKKIPKKKKVLPKLNKGRYGTGFAPGGWHGDHASDGGEGGGGDGGGGGD